MINDELLDVLIKLVEDAEGVLSIQAGTLAQRPDSQPVGNLFIDTTTRTIYRFNENGWESSVDPSVSEEVPKTEDPSPIVRAKSPF
ncbi:hypothetical protein PQ796_17150 [Priestia megaterium]|jgi:hypothetical protein|uniref:hypothetical protein n=1 Tax=Priestia TaxID=2800373 RepID=UPI000BF4AF7E|nr:MULTISPECIES: hypothetical protein [Priestia]MCY9026189.1 hypothetical protein [Priestia megaterium]MDH2452267.1 hypothetical protein [Priestia megaterium]MDL5151724.1 hypothetical protein [Priestia megaterium]MDP9723888.1 hypothetical protein [Priestia aryabhattai]MED3871847.1 hypothetical protein [Priestia megaterium]